MDSFPHHYNVKLSAQDKGNLTVTSGTLPVMTVAPPLQFEGPGDCWSPEELLMSSIASCLVLSFRAIAAASRLSWQSIECDSTGELEKVDRKVQFTSITSHVCLIIESGGDKAKAIKLLEKAEETCFISNSLNAPCHLICDIKATN